MATMVEDDAAFAKAWLDTPIFFAGAPSAEAAAKIPGCSVKSRERERPGGLPKHFGKLVRYGDECVVRGHDSPASPRFVWRGTQCEYHATWECD